MKILRKQTARFGLLLGDVAILSVSLYVTLMVRYLSLPTATQLSMHFRAFVWLFALWVIIFFIAGLYDRDTLLFPETLPQQIFQAQIVNSVLGITFFYAVPYFAIAPKTNLFIFVVLSFGFILLWRLVGARIVAGWLGSRRQLQAVLVAGGAAAENLTTALNTNRYRPLQVAKHIDPGDHTPGSLQEAVMAAVTEDGDQANNDESASVGAVILDAGQGTVRSAMPRLYNLLYEDIRLYQFDVVYEQIFERVPIQHIQHQWFIANLSFSPHIAYDWLKRGMDIAASVVLLVFPTAPLLPLIAFAIWSEDGGPIFYTQKRIGEQGSIITTVKFRSMTTGESKQVTSVGWFLRRTRLDELPQLVNVFRGDLSLIGPRPEIPELAHEYRAEIPYYDVRHLVKPGLSGWAQLKHQDPPKYDLEVEKTKDKLSYDLYYVKHRSLLLDIKIALRTLHIMASQSGK